MGVKRSEAPGIVRQSGRRKDMHWPMNRKLRYLYLRTWPVRDSVPDRIAVVRWTGISDESLVRRPGWEQ